MSIRGIIPALHTAFTSGGEFDPARQARLVERLITQGVHGLFAGGSTGEFPLLSLEEREELTRTVVSAAAGRIPVIIHAGAPDTRTAVRLARNAVAEKASAVSALPPYYYRHRPPELLDHFRAVAAASEPLPFYAYHLPQLTGVAMEPEIISGLLTIPNFAGLKWSDPDLFGLGEAVETFGPRADVLSGRDEVLLAALTLGARGAIGSTYNFLAPWFVSLWDSYSRGDLSEAGACQARSTRVIRVVLRPEGTLSPGKEATRWAGADCGEPRAPLKRYSDAERRALESELESAGLPRGGL